MPLQYCKQTMSCLKMWWLKTSVIYYRMFIIIGKKKQVTNEVKIRRVWIHLSYTWLPYWVDFYVSIMFHNFLLLVLVLVISRFLSSFVKDFQIPWSTTQCVVCSQHCFKFWNLCFVGCLANPWSIASTRLFQEVVV